MVEDGRIGHGRNAFCYEVLEFELADKGASTPNVKAAETNVLAGHPVRRLVSSIDLAEQLLCRCLAGPERTVCGPPIIGRACFAGKEKAAIPIRPGKRLSQCGGSSDCVEGITAARERVLRPARHPNG